MDQSLAEIKSYHYYECRFCSHPRLKTDSVEGNCERCGESFSPKASASRKLTLAFSLTALILYLPANIFPFMTVELYGNRKSSTIWSGIVSLADSGSYAIAIIIFAASLLIPFLKLAILFFLTLPPTSFRQQRFKMKLYHVVESIGRWSMLDIFLLAVLVAVMKLSPWTNVEPGVGSVMFALVVIFTMLASATFDPSFLWEKKFEREN